MTQKKIMHLNIFLKNERTKLWNKKVRWTHKDRKVTNNDEVRKSKYKVMICTNRIVGMCKYFLTVYISKNNKSFF